MLPLHICHNAQNQSFIQIRNQASCILTLQKFWTLNSMEMQNSPLILSCANSQSFKATNIVQIPSEMDIIQQRYKCIPSWIMIPQNKLNLKDKLQQLEENSFTALSIFTLFWELSWLFCDNSNRQEGKEVEIRLNYATLYRVPSNMLPGTDHLLNKNFRVCFGSDRKGVILKPRLGAPEWTRARNTRAQLHSAHH